MANVAYTDQEAANALISIIGDSRWEAVALARGYLAILNGLTDDDAARVIYNSSNHTLKNSKRFVERAKDWGFIALLAEREKLGSAETPITKLFPATITEQRFLDLLDDLSANRHGLYYTDERETSHSLVDFTIRDGDMKLPINIKNAGTRFEQARKLVILDPEDCIPIPAYKAHAALNSVPDLLYAVSVDYLLLGLLDHLVPSLLDSNERIVWDLLNRNAGSLVTDAEDRFIFSMVKKYWPEIKKAVAHNPFHVISSRKAIAVLHNMPQRTPGIGLRAWGTGANAEVNVHISIKDDTTPWPTVFDRIVDRGISDIIAAVNRKQMKEVYDPEI